MISFWRLDKIGDKKTWAARQEKLENMAGATLALANKELVVRRQPNEEDVYSEERLALETTLDRSEGQITAQEAEMILTFVNQRIPLLSDDQSMELAKVITGNDDPYLKVRKISELSPVLRRLMMSSVGVREGYLLHEHTQAVLGQFRRNIRSNMLDAKIWAKEKWLRYWNRYFVFKTSLNR